MHMGNLMRLSRKRNSTKEDIIEKATDLFYHQGFSSASIRDIVRAVGVTNSTVYCHFKDKHEILYKIVSMAGKAAIEAVEEAARSTDDPVERLRRMITAQVRLVKRHRREIKIWHDDQFQLPPPLRRKVIKQHQAIYDFYYDRISEIKAQGLLRDINQAAMTFSILAMMNWACRWYDEEGPLSIEEIAEDIARIFLVGVLKDGHNVKPSSKRR